MNHFVPFDLFSRRLLILTGKGGVGKTTLSSALALLAAKKGKRVLLAQMKSKDSIARLFGKKDSSNEIIQLDQNLSTVNIDPKFALAEYGRMILHSSFLYRQVFDREIVQNLLHSIPGLLEYAVLGKIWYHTTEEIQNKPRFDIIILDGPATGHALTFLQLPKIILKTVKTGPLVKSAQACFELLTDPNRCLAPIITLAEELPMVESFQLEQGLKKQGIHSGLLFINRFISSQFSKEEINRLSSLSSENISPVVLSLLDTFHFYNQQVSYQEGIQKQLASLLKLPQIWIPPLFLPTISKEILFKIAAILESQISLLSNKPFSLE